GLAGGTVDLFGIQPDLIFVLQQRPDKIASVLRATAAERQIFCLPEAADGKCPFWWKLFGTVEQTLSRPKLLSQFSVGRTHFRGVGAFKAVPGEQYKA